MTRIPRKLAGIGAVDIPDTNAFDAYIGPAREVTVDPERGIISLHDGATVGGKQFTNISQATYRVVTTSLNGIQDAINTGDDETVYVRSGTYSSGLVNGADGITLQGAGPHATVIKTEDASTSFTYLLSGVNAAHVQDIAFDGNKTGAPSSLQTLRISDGSSRYKLSNMWVHDSPTSGVGITNGCIEGEIEGSIFEYCDDYGVVSEAQGQKIVSSRGNNNGNFGFTISADYAFVAGCTMSKNGQSVGAAAGLLYIGGDYGIAYGNQTTGNNGHGTQFNDVNFSVQALSVNISNLISGSDFYSSPYSIGIGNVNRNNAIRGTEIDSGSDYVILAASQNWSNSDVDISIFRSEKVTLLGNNGNVRVWDSGSVASATVFAGGTGYAVDDIVTLVGGTNLEAATFRVTAVSAGVVTAVVVENAGNVWTQPTNPAATTGGTGTGLTLAVTWLGANSETCNGLSVIGGGHDNTMLIASGAASIDSINVVGWQGTINDPIGAVKTAVGCPAFHTSYRPLTLLNSWDEYDVNWQAPVYWLDAEGWCHLSGSMKSGTSASGTIIANLPVGFRPEKVEGPFLVYGLSSYASVYISTNGDIIAQSNLDASLTSLCGIKFRVSLS